MIIPATYYVIFFMLGAVLGSFSSAIIYRERHGVSWAKDNDQAARSKCTNCGHVLDVKDLIPIFSWVFQKGKCRYCQHQISFFYPLLEITSGIFILLLLTSGVNFLLTLLLFFYYPFFISFFLLLWRYKHLSSTLSVINFIFAVFLCAFIFIFPDNAVKY